MKPKVYITHELPSKDALDKLCNVYIREEEYPLTKQELIYVFDEEVLENVNKLKVVSACSTSVDHTPGTLSEANSLNGKG